MQDTKNAVLANALFAVGPSKKIDGMAYRDTLDPRDGARGVVLAAWNPEGVTRHARWATYHYACTQEALAFKRLSIRQGWMF